MSRPNNSPLTLDVAIERWPLAAPFHISGFSFDEAELIVVSLLQGRYRGRGEAAGVYYRGDSAETMVAEIEAVRRRVEKGITRDELRELMKPGGARNAVDCALWDLEAKGAGMPAWQLAGNAAPISLVSTFTIGVDTPAAMAAYARDNYAYAKAIKLKLNGDEQDGDRVAAVRAARGDVWLGVDANQGLDPFALYALIPALVAARVQVVEQPFKVGEEALLDGIDSPIAFAADESLQSLADLPRLIGRFQVLNIKLDKCGGLTEGLLIAAEARKLGLRVMVGGMPGTSLAMAPAFLLGQQCDIVDLDAPIFLSKDRIPAAEYRDGKINVPDKVWG